MAENFFEKWTKVMFQPDKFYEKLPRATGFKEPTLFAFIVISVIYLLLGILILLIGSLYGLSQGLTYAGIVTAVLVAGVIYAVGCSFAILFIYLWSAILHLFVNIFKGRGDYKETFTAVAYATAPNVLSFIPIISFFAGIYGIVLQVIGIHKRHKLSVGKSVGVVLIPVAIISVIFLVIYFFMIASLIAGGYM